MSVSLGINLSHPDELDEASFMPAFTTEYGLDVPERIVLNDPCRDWSLSMTVEVARLVVERLQAVIAEADEHLAATAP